MIVFLRTDGFHVAGVCCVPRDRCVCIRDFADLRYYPRLYFSGCSYRPSRLLQADALRLLDVSDDNRRLLHPGTNFNDYITLP